MPDNRDSFNIYISKVKLDSIYYIDKLDIKVDDLSTYRQVTTLLENRNGKRSFKKVKITQEFERSSVYRNQSISRLAVGFKIEILWPVKKLIWRLAEILTHSSYTISSLEIAYDIKTSSIDVTHELIDRLSEQLVIPSIKGYPSFMQDGKVTRYIGGIPIDSIYIGSYEDPNMFKIYIPEKKGKMFGKTCFHSEFRLDGAETIRNHGIWTLHDLAELNYQEFYNKHVKLFDPPKTRVGAIYRRINNLKPAKDRQCQKNCDRHFGAEKSLAHHLYHLTHKTKKPYRDALIPRGTKWMKAKNVL